EALMRRDNPADLPRLARLRRLASRLWAGLPLLALGCASGPVALAQAVNPQPPLSPFGRGVGGEGVLIFSPSPLAPLPQGAREEQPAVKQLPIGLDTVLRLAEEQNGQVALAREKVQEAYADQDLARKSAWLPAVNVGTAYYRHEGGTQNPD